MLQLLGSRLTETHTSTEGAKNVLGEIYDHQGKRYRYVKNSTGSAFGVAKVVCLDLTADDGYSVVLPPATAASSVAGVTISAIPASGFGWIQTGGPASVDFDGTAADSAAGAPVMAFSTAGKCGGVDTTVATNVNGKFGIALDTSTTDVTLDVFLMGLI